jgi:hypothetical protein
MHAHKLFRPQIKKLRFDLDDLPLCVRSGKPGLRADTAMVKPGRTTQA